MSKTIRFCIGLLLLLLAACAPGFNSSDNDFDISSQLQTYWVASPTELEALVLEVARKFDSKFANAYYSNDLSGNTFNIHEITLNQRAYTDSDKPYRLTIFIAWAKNSSRETAFLLMNEEDVATLEFPSGTLAFNLNAELVKALDAKFARAK
jgi:hypothetical protein